MRFPLDATSHFTDDVALMTEEARAAKAAGVALIVDGGHPDMHRSLEAVRRIATDSGLPVVASGGYYMQRSYPAALAEMSAEQIADELTRDAIRDRLGAFGEIGQQDGTLTETERKVFRAVGMAQARTGLPVFTHNPYLGQRPGGAEIPRDAALRQLDILEEAGAMLDKVAIGHLCCLHDPKAEVAVEIARRGAFVGFDRVTLAIVPDADKVVAARALVQAGHADKLLLSSDFASPRALKKNGGPGLAQTATVFGPMLVRAGLPARHGAADPRGEPEAVSRLHAARVTGPRALRAASSGTRPDGRATRRDGCGCRGRAWRRWRGGARSGRASPGR